MGVLGTNDVNRVICTINPPTGPFGLAVTAFILGLLPDNAGSLTFPFQVQAKAAGTYLQAARTTPLNSMTSGADGAVVFNTSRDKSGTITATIMQKSPTTSLMSAMLIAQDQFEQDFYFNMEIIDTTDGALYTGYGCKITGHPQRTFASDAAATLEYPILVAELRMSEITAPGY